jgi:NhaP-type Na+/H+ or K+/H+ antiporter
VRWLIIASALYFVYALVSKRLSTTAITGPMLFVAAGLALGTGGFDIVEAESTDQLITILLEATLAIVLFSDAAVINSTDWRREAFIPGRLLLIGLPLTIAFGLVVASLMFTDLSFWEAGIVAAILAPTDAALGQAVISNPRVPQRIRQGLATESGLNDGVALTAVLILLAGAEESLTGGSIGNLLGFFGRGVVLAAFVGVGIGWFGGRALVAVNRKGWIAPTWVQIGALALGVGAYSIADAMGASGFIAVWLAGLTVGRETRDRLDDVTAFSETLGTSLTMMSFVVFGAVLLGPAIENVTWTIVIFAVLSLTLVRMLPVALAMVGSRLQPRTVTFLGWFGPRGLASMVLASVVVESSALPAADLIIMIAMITVGLSVLAHGATSWAGSESYADWHEKSARSDEYGADESAPTEGVPKRFQSPGTAHWEHSHGP